MSQNNPFFIPNLDKNFKLEEFPEGIMLKYILSCDKDFPKYSFVSKGKHYVERKYFISYKNNMSVHIFKGYNYLKNSTMLELALHKHELILTKIKQLQNNLNNV